MLPAMSDTQTPSQKPRAAQRRTPKPATHDRLHKAALHYLERYASSSANLRRVLQRRVERSARLHGTDRTEAAAWVDAIIERLTTLGLLDDRRYAEGRAASLHRRGASLRKIAGMLHQKGVASDQIDDALRALRDATPAPDLVAAVRLARRRRLGPWREPASRAERRDRDLAALARAGFSYDLASRIVDADSPDVLDQAIAEAEEG